MKRNSSLCFLVNIDRVLFNAAPLRARRPRREPARLDLAQTVNERYTFALRSASPLEMLHLTDQGARCRDATKSAASRVLELVSGFASPERHARLMIVLQAGCFLETRQCAAF